jgi:predicted transcriptional regulator
MDIRQISKIVGISETRVSKILKANKMPTHNLATKLENGLSETQRKALKVLNKRMNKVELKQKNSLVIEKDKVVKH